MIIKKPCEFCGKVTEITSEIDLGSAGKLITRACNHSYIEQSVAQKAEQNLELGIETLITKLEAEEPFDCEVHGRKCIKSLTSKTGKHLFPYQREGIIRALKANAKFIFADEMGLGKTIQGLGTILSDKENLLPAIVLCKSIAKTNWLREVLDWMIMPAQVIESSSDTPFEMFKIHILSYDMINRLDKLFKFSEMKDYSCCPKCENKYDAEKNLVGTKCPNCSVIKKHQSEGPREVETIEQDGKLITRIKVQVESIQEREKEIPLLEQWIDKSLISGNLSARDQNRVTWEKIIKNCKTIILDEVHLIKSQTAQRTKAVKTICKFIPHALPMSGTLIKNYATEYFTPLNIVRPEKYWRYESFCQSNVRYEYVRSITGNMVKKYTGLLYPDHFMKSVKDFMIRRTTDDVLPELPKLTKQQKFVEMDKELKEVYEEMEGNFAEWFEGATKQEIMTNLLAQLAVLRHQTSLAKVSFTIDLALEFLLSTDRKLAIFTHHIDSREFLIEKLMRFFRDYYKEIGEENKEIVKVLTQGKDVQEEIDEFKNSKESRIIVLSTLSHGESINLQFMSDCILHERQWNPANENQAISGRFRRIGQESKHINCMIPVAIGTIDEAMVEINERKDVVAKEIDTGEIGDYETNFVAELANTIAERGRRKWKLPENKL